MLKLNNLILLIYSFSIVLFSWLLNSIYLNDTVEKALIGYMAFVIYLTGSYFYFEKKKFKFNIKLAMVLFLIMALSTPILMETDPYRYVWDGFISSKGINPYRFSPKENPFYSSISWSGNINHPHLTTIYPPGAQILFFISTYLNPFFYSKYFTLNSIWGITLGLKVIVGLTASSLLYLLRKENWNRLFFHPCFILLGIIGAHIDFFIIPIVLGLFFYHPLRVGESKGNNLRLFTLVFGILIKFIPIIYTPILLVDWIKNRGWGHTLSKVFLGITSLLFFYIIFFKGSQGRIFESLEVYNKHWYFFGFIHQYFLDFFRRLGLQNPFIWSKLSCALIGVSIAFRLVWMNYKGQFTQGITAMFLTLFFLCLSPTLHPWYLLILLPFAYRYYATFWTPVIWPFLGLFSKLFYLNNQDPFWTRNLIYSIILILIIRDWKKALN